MLPFVPPILCADFVFCIGAPAGNFSKRWRNYEKFSFFSIDKEEKIDISSNLLTDLDGIGKRFLHIIYNVHIIFYFNLLFLVNLDDNKATCKISILMFFNNILESCEKTLKWLNVSHNRICSVKHLKGCTNLNGKTLFLFSVFFFNNL